MPRVFISLRFGEALDEAKALKQALERRGVSCFVCAVQEGGNIAVEVAHNIVDSELVVVLGTKTYGKKTNASYSTHEEMMFIMEEQKPFFLVKMCDRFEEKLTRFYFNSTIAYYPWKGGKDVPVELLNRIVEKLDSVSGVDSITKGVSSMSTSGSGHTSGSESGGHSIGRSSDPSLEWKTLPYGNGVYEGETKNNKMHGRGVFKFHSGNRYEGDWEDGFMHGHGTYLYNNGDRYEGQWWKSKLQGRGIFQYADGDRYEGEYLDGVKSGRGTYYYASGNRYEGMWRNDMLNGKGTFYYADGDRHDGEYKDNKRGGWGIYTYKNGDTQEGNYINDREDGEHTFTPKGGRARKITYRNGQRA